MRKATPTSSKMKSLVGQSEKATTSSSASVEEHLGIDGPIQPSTSTFTLSGKDDKSEKLKKKARNFLDERQKIKPRTQSLWSLIDASNTFDQARFFQEHAEQVFQVVYDTCMHQIEKIKHKSERPQSWNSKELVILQKNLLLLRKIFLYVPELMRNGWQRQNIAKILTYILDHGNHPRLRALGFQLLLLWLNDQVVEYPECMDLFSNAISLDLFILDDIQTFNTTSTCSTNNINTNTTNNNNNNNNNNTNINNVTTSNPNDTSEVEPNQNKLHSLQFVKKLRESHADKQINHGLQRDERIKTSNIQLDQTLILGDDTQPIYPNPTQPTFNDSIVLIHIFISNLVRLAYVAAGSPPPPDEYEYPPGDHFEPDDGIATGVGIDAATASAKFLFKIFRTHYMTKFVPLISKSLQVESSLKTGVSGFPSCPPTILRSLLRFLIGYCLDNNHNVNINWPHLSQISSPATPILKSIVLSSHETREMLHEMLRQSLILPCTNVQYRDITRGAIHILGVWILGSEDERPSFLRRSGSVVTRSSSTASVSNSINDTATSSSSRAFSSSPPEDNGMKSTTAAATANEEYSDANVFLRRYLLMIKLVFEDRRPEPNSRDNLAATVQQVSDWEGLVALYKDAINVYRAISVSRGGIDIEWESWELMLQCLLDIQQWFMSQPEKYSRIPVQALAEDLADYIWETLLHSFVRAKILHMDLWQNLRVHMVSSMRWVQALNQWVKIMQKLTRLLSSRLYKVEYELQTDNRYRLIEELPNVSTVSNRYSSHFGSGGRAMSGGSNRVKVRSRHLSMQGNPRQGGSPKRAASGRPLSGCGSEGQLTELKQQDKDSVDPTPEGSVSTILRNLSSASLSELANTFKTDRKSTNLTSVPDEEGAEEEEEEGNTKHNSKFGIKNVKPTASFSNTPASSIHSNSNVTPMNSSIGKRSNTNNSGNSLAGSVGEKSVGRRTISIQQLDTLWQDSGSKLLNFVHHGDSSHAQNTHSKIVPQKEEEKKVEWDRKSATSSIDEISNKSNRTPGSSVWASGESIIMMTNPASITEKLPNGLGAFKSSEFLVLSNLSYDGQQVLTIWKNMLLAIGNINHIERPHNYAIAMQCVVDIWDTLRLVRAQQPYRDVPIPAMYEVAPWLFQATELPCAFDVGKAAAYGSLCRLMSQRPEEKVPEGYYAAFYKAVLKGLDSKDNTIIQAIILNSERLFGFSLPGIHILIPSFINAIEGLLLIDGIQRDVPSNVRKSCITILGSLLSVSNHLKNISIQVDKVNMVGNQGIEADSFSFSNVKVWLKNVCIRLVNACPVVQHEDDNDTHSMLLGALCTLALDEMLATESPQYDIIHECVLSLVNHLYWCNIPIVNNVADCLTAFAHVYKEELDPEGIIVQEVLTRIIDSLNVHLKHYEKNTKTGRGFIISKLFCCLLEWLMSISTSILTETDLCQLVFDVIEVALHVSLEGAEKLLPRSPRPTDPNSKKKETSFKFKLLSEKRPHIQYDLINNVEVHENDQGYVKESAEAVLLHLLHHFNNFAPPYGPGMIHSSIAGPGVAQDDTRYHQYQYFSFNDTTIIAFVEIPKTETKRAQARMIIRDLTGRYVWDAQLEPNLASETDLIDHSLERNEFELRQDVRIKSVDQEPNEQTLNEPIKDPMDNLLKQIGELHPDCLLDPSLPLNLPSPCTSLQLDMLGDLGTGMNEYLHNESQNNEKQESDIHVWYNKMNLLRKKEMEDGVLKRGEESMQTQLMTNFSLQKDFLPAFPQEAEQAHVPFQQSRLLLSHMGLVHYSHLKDGSFKMLNKSPALYRDLRGLDRKHGRETMKIGLIYVGHGQEDEQSILQNNRGSERYNAFVNSLGWEVDIATHAGYLGGLEKNLTNGTKATYYCSSTVEMIFHDVTKMPTDTSDPKQLKKKRHIGNDHVHIVWNEHDRDYRIDTIGGDFGNAQIIVTPLPDSLYLVQIYKDSKIPYFGPLFDRMIVSQATLGSLVRSTAINAFRATVHTNLYSYYKCVYAQRSNDVRTITNRHKAVNWSYEQFMEKIFMPEEHI